MIRGCLGGIFRLLIVLVVIGAIVIAVLSFVAANGNQFSHTALSYIPKGYGVTFEGWAEAVVDKISSLRGGPSASSSQQQKDPTPVPTEEVDNRPDWSVTLDTGSFDPPEGAACTPGAEYVQSFKILNGGKNDWTGATLERVTGLGGPEKIPDEGSFDVPAGGSAQIEYKVACQDSPGSGAKTSYQLSGSGQKIGEPIVMPR
jgi:hypothetical protein